MIEAGKPIMVRTVRSRSSDVMGRPSFRRTIAESIGAHERGSWQRVRLEERLDRSSLCLPKLGCVAVAAGRERLGLATTACRRLVDQPAGACDFEGEHGTGTTQVDRRDDGGFSP